MQITLQELMYKNNPNIIDIRNENEFLMGTIPSSKNIPAIKLEISPEKYLNKNETYYIFCNNGKTSKVLTEKLNIQGYRTVNIIGGYLNYLLRK